MISLVYLAHVSVGGVDVEHVEPLALVELYTAPLALVGCI